MAFLSDDEAYPVTRITAGAVGEPGRRVFILQAQMGDEIVSWVIDKEHAVALCQRLPRLLDEVLDEYPELGEPMVAATPNLALREPLKPEFRVGSIGIGYDRVHDLIVLQLGEEVPDKERLEDLSAEQEELAETRVYTTRGQAWLLSHQAQVVVAAGRPLCPECGEPMDDFGHFCLPVAARGLRRDGYLL